MKKLEKSGFKRSNMFSRPELKGRGWTDAMIRKFLPSEDATAPNPEYVNAGSPMKLYRRNRVKRIEASEKFQEAMQAAAKRKESASKAVKTKLNKMRAYLDKLAIDVPKKEKMALITASQQNFYSLRLPEEVELSDERKCVNYLRHCCTKYERELAAITGKTGAANAYYEIKEKVLDAIAIQYDWLAEECDRQLQRLRKEQREQ